MKNKIILVMIATIFALTVHAQKDTTWTNVEKFVYDVDVQKTKVVYNINDANKLLNSGVKDMLFCDKSEGTIMIVRILKVSDGRIIRIETGEIWFYFAIEYYDATKKNPEKLVECSINKNGKVVATATKYHFDPKGKDGIVMPDESIKKIRSGHAKVEYTGQPPISDKDPLVIRYQKEVDAALKLFYGNYGNMLGSRGDCFFYYSICNNSISLLHVFGIIFFFKKYLL